MDFLVEESKPTYKSNSLWVEKYRPPTMDSFVGNESLKDALKKMVVKKDIPHLLFYGSPGTGKTTASKILTNNIPCDHLYINASDENGIDTVREKLKFFCAGAGFKSLKIVVLDECDYLSTNAMAGLRNMMEAYSAHTRFILTCNFVEKIIPAIVSRCQTFEIKPLSKKDIALKLTAILKEESIVYTQDDIVFMVNTYYPDIRKIINFAQQSNTNGTIQICKENLVEIDTLNKLIVLLSNPTKANVFNEIRELVVDIDPNSLESVYKYLFDKVDTFAKGKEAIIIAELAESLYQSALIITKARDITFLACIYKILKHLK